MDETPAATHATTDRRNRTARRWAFGLLVALLVQFGIGMYVNLFTHIPLYHPGHGAGNYLTGTSHSMVWAETSQYAPFILATHAGLGLLLVACSLWPAAQAARARRSAVTWAGILGALCILGAGFSGGSLLDYNTDVSSYIMALLFAAAVLCYGVILALPGGSERRSPAY